MFYDTFKFLCAEKGISCNKAALEIGLSNATPTKWKKTGATPDSTTLRKIADYFDVSVDYLLGNSPNLLELVAEDNGMDHAKSILQSVRKSKKEKAPTKDGERQISDNDIKFALFGGDGEITDAMYEEVKRFAHMVKLREEAEKKKE